MPRVCALCREPGKLTAEHVIPRWVNTLLKPKGPVSIARESEAALELGHEVVTRRVCVTCNTGWLSRLEGDASRVLSGPILGERTVLSQKDQRTIASWVTKVHLLLDLAHPLDRMVPDSELEDFGRTHQPPQRAVILMGGFDDDRAPGLFYRTLLHVPDETGRHPQDANGYVLTFNVFRVLFQMIGHHSPTAFLDVKDSRPIDRAIFCIWPGPEKPAMWPPHNVFGSDSMVSLHESASGFRPRRRLR